VDRLILVSNRLPVTLRQSGSSWSRVRSPGGLATALGPLGQLGHTRWVGCAGAPLPDDGEERAALIESWSRDNLHVVDLPEQVEQGFYDGYANETLWPVLHGFPSRTGYEPESWQAYVDANRRFAASVLDVAGKDDVVWVHDYHLMLVPALLREQRPDLKIGFFLHVPFPPAEVFSVLPRREALLRGLLGADLVGFHTRAYRQNFRSTLVRLLGLRPESDRAQYAGRTTRFGAFPVGIVPEELYVGPRRDDEAVADRIRALRASFRDHKLLLAIDRLDYTKGIPERLGAFRHLLDRNSALRGRVTLVQVAVPSRERVAAYRALGADVSRLVGEINGSYGTAEWTPVVYMRHSLPRPELLALYAVADVGWVTPLRDGMNLVAKEYVACQESGAGVLVLSEFAGAVEELTEALVVNPYDVEAVADAVERAVTMPAAERRARMAAMRERVLHHDASDWARRFLGELSRAPVVDAGARPAPPDALCHAFPAARETQMGVPATASA
jgi:trehalose 6-phosphate synthase/phosphatase